MFGTPGSVTIGIPTYNRRPHLQRALESLLDQTWSDMEIIISDDASTDDTADYLAELTDPRLVRIRQPTNIGMTANFQACLAASTSEFFLLLNDDDTLLPTAIEKLRHAFLNPPNNVPSESVGVAWCPFTNINIHGQELWTIGGAPAIEPTIDLIAGLFDGTRGLISSGVMMRTSDALAVGGYEARFGDLCESAAWGRSALSRDFAVCVDEPLMHYLIHQQSITTGQSSSRVWQDIVRREVDEFVAFVQSRGDTQGASRLRASGNHLLANITASVMMRWIGRPGWISDCARELWHSRRIMFTPFALLRLIRDGGKLIRLHRLNAHVADRKPYRLPAITSFGGDVL